jgi:uncharacterized protein YcfJ
VATLLILCVCQGASAEAFTDYAQVVSTHPVVATSRVPVSRRQCSPDPRYQRPGVEMSVGDPTPHALVDAIRAELKLRSQARHSLRCRTVRSWESREQVVGYRVWYRYQGQTLVKQLDYDPGERLRVVVELEPVH